METTRSSYKGVTALLDDADDAEKAYFDLLDIGIKREAISISMSESSLENTHSGKRLPGSEQTHVVDDAGRGALIGGATGGIAAVVAAINSYLVLPGLGLVIMGPLLAGLAGIAGGAIAGGTIGAIIGSGFPHAHAKTYETANQSGSILVGATFTDPEERDRIIEVLKKHAGEHIQEDTVSS